MNRTEHMLEYARRTGKCPVCRKRSRALWHDTGRPRVTCGNYACYLQWLPGHEKKEDAEETNHPSETTD